MRKIILGSVLVCSLLSSCNLDIEPENSMTYRNSFNTEKELNATTTSIQYYINSTIGSNFVLSMAGVLADNVQSNTQLREWNPRTVLSNDYSWKGLYDIIFESNLISIAQRTSQKSVLTITRDKLNLHWDWLISFLHSVMGMPSLQRTLLLLRLMTCLHRLKSSTQRLIMRRKR